MKIYFDIQWNAGSSSNLIPNRIQGYNTVCMTKITNSRVIIDIVMWFCWWPPEKPWAYQAGSHKVFEYKNKYWYIYDLLKSHEISQYLPRHVENFTWWKKTYICNISPDMLKIFTWWKKTYSCNISSDMLKICTWWKKTSFCWWPITIRNKAIYRNDNDAVLVHLETVPDWMMWNWAKLTVHLIFIHQCACWWPNEIRCWGICRYTEEKKMALILYKNAILPVKEFPLRRQFYGHLISMMGFFILIKRHVYIN